MFTTNDKLSELFHTEHTGESFVIHYYKAYIKIKIIFCPHSPDAMKVSKHLSNTTGQNAVIKPSDYICFTCYRTHCSIIESLTTPHISNTALQQSTEELVCKYNDNITDKLTKAILEAVLQYM